MRTVKVAIPEGMYLAARELAAKRGTAVGNSSGIAALMRAAIRAELSKNGYPATDLDKDANTALPDAREGAQNGSRE